MADDDERGGTPACFLDEVDPAYAGYLTEAELGAWLVGLRARVRTAHAMARTLGRERNATALGGTEAMLTGELERRGLAPDASARAGLAPRFAAPADSPPSPAGLAALEAEVVGAIEAALPRIASDTLHDALNRALIAHRVPSAP